MAHWPDHYVNDNGIRIHYTRTGGDKPLLVLLHGLTDQGLCWTVAARDLQADYDVIMPDARGHGLSEAPATGGYGTEVLAADLAGLITALDLGPVRLLGHSMGAMTALHLAAYYPDLVRAAVLEDPPLGNRQEATPAEREATAARWQENQRSRQALSREQLIAETRQGNPNWSEEELELWADARPYVRVNFAQLFSTPPGTGWRETLAQVQCPTLLLVPERGIVSPEIAEEAAGILPSLTVGHIPGAGHCIRRDQTDEYMRVVREFLARA